MLTRIFSMYYTVYWMATASASEDGMADGTWLSSGNLNNRTTTFTIQSLIPNSGYEVGVVVARPGAGGEGPMSSIAVVHTPRE